MRFFALAFRNADRKRDHGAACVYLRFALMARDRICTRHGQEGKR